jgi:hypothetical protein
VPPCHIDHITITAPTLAAGAALVWQTLGVKPQVGGEHPRMGTHNLLLRLGPALFLEVIAANPAAPAPGRPRWFALDNLHADTPSALTTWVVRTPDIHATVAACPEALGPVEPMSRGSLNWLITIPADGSVPVDGIAPALIEWQTAGHPAARLAEHGLSLAKLEICHPDAARLSRMLAAIGLEGSYGVSPLPAGSVPHLVAHINTPQGLRVLSTATPAT